MIENYIIISPLIWYNLELVFFSCVRNTQIQLVIVNIHFYVGMCIFLFVFSLVL